MKFVLPLLLLAASLQGCYVFRMPDGAKERQIFPARDKFSTRNIDTARFVYRSFRQSDFDRNISHIEGKRLVESVSATDVRSLLETNGQYYLYFWDPGCPASRAVLGRMDSLSKTGAQVMMLSMRRNVAAIDPLLSRTAFARYPVYLIDGPSTVILRRQIDFIKDACNSCYVREKDRLSSVDYLLLEKGSLRAVHYADSGHVFRGNRIAATDMLK